MFAALPHPALSCSESKDGVSEHNLILGTHTAGEQNYLMIASATLPCENDAEIAVAGAPIEYEAEVERGYQKSRSGAVKIWLKIAHDGEVNR